MDCQYSDNISNIKIDGGIVIYHVDQPISLKENYINTLIYTQTYKPQENVLLQPIPLLKPMKLLKIFKPLQPLPPLTPIISTLPQPSYSPSSSLFSLSSIYLPGPPPMPEELPPLPLFKPLLTFPSNKLPPLPFIPSKPLPFTPLKPSKRYRPLPPIKQISSEDMSYLLKKLC